MESDWLRAKVDALATNVRSLGLLGAAVYSTQRIRLRVSPPKAKYVRLLTKHARHPLHCRPGTSDMTVFGQIYREREYRCLDDVRDVGLVIDCGANVGYSSAYFLSRYPDATVIAVEPDGDNFEVLRRNTAPFGTRCRAKNTGVWSHSTGLVMSEEAWGDGTEWARTVRPVVDGEVPSMIATDIGTLLAESGFDRISILKVDIEGAEAIVFGSNYERWLGKVDNLVIELHGDHPREVFLRAIANERFTTSTSDELFVCKRERRAS